MSSVGEVLRGARLEQRLDLPTLSARTKISVRYLEAIEADDRRCFPSGFFYKSFVDQYAGILGLDVSAINAEVDRLLSEDAPLPLPGFESVVSKNVPPVKSVPRFPSRAGVSLAVVLLAAAGCAGVYGWWHRAELAGFARALRKPVATTRSVAVSNPSSQESEALPPQESLQPAASEDPGAGADKVQLDLMAREATWLSVSSDGRRLFSGVLAANQTKTVEGKESATMKVGNAAGIEVRLNGKLLGPLGSRGQVLVVVFTPDNFQIVPQAPKEGD